MSLIFLDGVDDGMSGFKWTSGAYRDTGAARTGTASLLIGVSSGAGGTPSYTLPAADRHSTMIAGAGVYFAGNTVTYDIMQFAGSAGATHVYVQRLTNGVVQIVHGTAGVLAATGPNVCLLQTWYHMEFKAVIADAGGSAILRINGVQVLSFTGDTRNAGADANVYSFTMASQGSGAGDRQARADDVYLLNGAGSVNNDLIGDCKVLTLYPNNNGNYSQGVGSDGNSVDNYLLVDDPNVPSATDYVNLVTTADKDSYAFDNVPTGSTIFGIAQRAYATKTDAGARTIRNFQRIAGTDYPSAVDFGLSVTPTYSGASDIVETSPATAVPWTVTEINAAEFGAEARP